MNPYHLQSISLDSPTSKSIPISYSTPKKMQILSLNHSTTSKSQFVYSKSKTIKSNIFTYINLSQKTQKDTLNLLPKNLETHSRKILKIEQIQNFKKNKSREQTKTKSKLKITLNQSLKSWKDLKKQLRFQEGQKDLAKFESVAQLMKNKIKKNVPKDCKPFQPIKLNTEAAIRNV